MRLVYTLLLVQPVGRVYRAAPDDELAQEARRLAERDLAAGGQSPGQWPQEELDRWMEHRWRYWEMYKTYALVRDPSLMSAPLAWPDELLGLTLGTFVAALHDGRSTMTPRGWRGAAATALSELAGAHAAAARQRRVRALALDPMTAPRACQPIMPAWLVLVVLAAIHELRHNSPGAMPWPEHLASQVVATLNERRSWRRARARLTPPAAS